MRTRVLSDRTVFKEAILRADRAGDRVAFHSRGYRGVRSAWHEFGNKKLYRVASLTADADYSSIYEVIDPGSA